MIEGWTVILMCYHQLLRSHHRIAALNVNGIDAPLRVA